MTPKCYHIVTCKRQGYTCKPGMRPVTPWTPYREVCRRRIFTEGIDVTLKCDHLLEKVAETVQTLPAYQDELGGKQKFHNDWCC